VRACLPVPIPQDGVSAKCGRINFSKQMITPPFTFNLKGILKSMEENPIKFGSSGEENLNGFTFNSLKHKKKKKVDIGYFFDVLASHKSEHIHLPR